MNLQWNYEGEFNAEDIFIENTLINHICVIFQGRKHHKAVNVSGKNT